MTDILSNPLFLLLSITGLMLLLAALILKIFPPQKINHFYGYRSPASRKSLKHWKFAQIFAARELSRVSLILISLGILGLFSTTDPRLGAIAAGFIIIIFIAYLIYKVELAIKKKFKE